MGAFFTLKAIESFNITDSVLYDTIDGELRSYCDDSAITSIDRCCQKLRKLIKLLSEYIYINIFLFNRLFNSDNQAKVILFVETRVETNILSKILPSFLPTLRPVWLCGHGKSGSLITMTRNQQEAAIKQFERVYF